eukprot:scaffold59306_cov19-Tisochrysis_lutea.AAC.1
MQRSCGSWMEKSQPVHTSSGKHETAFTGSCSAGSCSSWMEKLQSAHTSSSKHRGRPALHQALQQLNGKVAVCAHEQQQALDRPRMLQDQQAYTAAGWKSCSARTEPLSGWV